MITPQCISRSGIASLEPLPKSGRTYPSGQVRHLAYMAQAIGSGHLTASQCSPRTFRERQVVTMPGLSTAHGRTQPDAARNSCAEGYQRCSCSQEG